MVEPIKDILDEHVRKKQFKYGATLPISWKYQALLLKRASDTIFINYFNAHKKSEPETLVDALDVGQIPVYLLLMGFAIENLIKGLLFFQHPEYLVSGNRLSKKVTKSHQLLPLFERAGWTFEPNDKYWLKYLSIYATWRGRYAVPLNLYDMLPKKEKDGTWTESFLPDDPRRAYEEINGLYERVMKKLSDESQTWHPQLPTTEF